MMGIYIGLGFPYNEVSKMVPVGTLNNFSIKCPLMIPGTTFTTPFIPGNRLILKLWYSLLNITEIAGYRRLVSSTDSLF